MALEIHTCINDYAKRYINLNEIFKSCHGWKHFGEWVDKGDYLECNAGYMALYANEYNRLMSEYHLKYNDYNMLDDFPVDDNEETTKTFFDSIKTNTNVMQNLEIIHH